MKEFLASTVLILFTMSSQAQSDQSIKDRLDLKNLVDTFSNLADIKDISNQVLLFTEDAIVESYTGENQTSRLVGREQIGAGFSSFLNLFETVYHQNGQQTVQVNGNEASGISYCTVTLIGNTEGVRTMTTFGVRYNDNYVRKNGQWLIAKRISNFIWQDVKPVN